MKKFFIALVIVIAVLAFPIAALAQTTYTDVAPGHAAEQSIYRLTMLGIVQGNGAAATFQPDSGMTRAQFAVIACRLNAVSADALAIYGSLPSPFKDVADNAWYSPYVNACFDLGLMLGSGGRFNPNGIVTRAELATVILRAVGYSQFDGWWPQNYLDKALELGLITTAKNGEITRGEMAQIIDAALELPMVYHVEDDEAAVALREQNLTVDADNYLLLHTNLLATFFGCYTEQATFTNTSKIVESGTTYLFYQVGDDMKWAAVANECWGAEGDLDYTTAVLTINQAGQVIFVKVVD